MGEGNQDTSASISYRLTSVDIAAHYGISDQTVRNMAKREEIPGKWVGKQWRFNLEEVKAAVDSQTDARFRRQKSKNT